MTIPEAVPPPKGANRAMPFPEVPSLTNHPVGLDFIPLPNSP